MCAEGVWRSPVDDPGMAVSEEEEGGFTWIWEMASVAGLTEPEFVGCGCCSDCCSSAAGGGGLFRGLPDRGLGTSLSAMCVSLLLSLEELAARGFLNGKGVGRRNVDVVRDAFQVAVLVGDGF